MFQDNTGALSLTVNFSDGKCGQALNIRLW